LKTLRALPPFDHADPWVGKRVDFEQFDGNGGLYLPQGVDADFIRFNGTVADLRAFAKSCRLVPFRREFVELGDGGPANPLGRETRAEADAAARAEASTNPGTPSAISSDRIAAMKLPVEDPDATWNGDGPKGGGAA